MERSYETPSLRVIDFGRMCGRAEFWGTWEEPKLIPVLTRSEFDEYAMEDEIRAYRMVKDDEDLGLSDRMRGIEYRKLRPKTRCSWEATGFKVRKDGVPLEKDYVYMELEG